MANGAQDCSLSKLIRLMRRAVYYAMQEDYTARYFDLIAGYSGQQMNTEKRRCIYLRDNKASHAFYTSRKKCFNS